MVGAVGQRPGQSALSTELRLEGSNWQGSDLADGVESKPAQPYLVVPGHRKKVHGESCEEAGHVVRDSRGPPTFACYGGDVGWELRPSQPYARVELLRHRVQQSGHDPGLPTVHCLKSVHSNIGATELSLFDDRAPRE